MLVADIGGAGGAGAVVVVVVLWIAGATVCGGIIAEGSLSAIGLPGSAIGDEFGVYVPRRQKSSFFQELEPTLAGGMWAFWPWWCRFLFQKPVEEKAGQSPRRGKWSWSSRPQCSKSKNS